MPTVSVIMPSYNHACYIGMAINSVLGQTLQDIELIVIDDASTDGTQEILRGIKDKRVRCILRERNVGASYGSNEGIAMSRSPYIAMISSDDFFLPTKLEQQLEVFTSDKKVTAVFCRPRIVDAMGRPFRDGKHYLQAVFASGSWQQPDLVRRLFLQGNFLCHPSVMVRRKTYDDVGPYDTRLSSLGDFDMWMRMGLDCDGAFVVLDDQLIDFRYHSTNTSGQTDENLRCAEHEWPIIAAHILSLRDKPSLFTDIFPESKPFLHGSPEDVLYAICRLAIEHQVGAVRAFGLQQLYALMANPETSSYLASEHAFTPNDLIKLSQTTITSSRRHRRRSLVTALFQLFSRNHH